MNEPCASLITPTTPGVKPKGTDERTYHVSSSTMLAVVKAIKAQWEPDLGEANEQALDAFEKDLEGDVAAERLACAILKEIEPYFAFDCAGQPESVIHDLAEYGAEKVATTEVGAV